MTAADLLQCIWGAALASTAVIAIVSLLRAPWRRVFGAEHACRLWWLPPLALIIALVPHFGMQLPTTIVSTTLILHPVASSATQVVIASTPFDWDGLLVLLWTTGFVMCVASAIRQQCAWGRVLRTGKPLFVEPPRGVATVLGAPDISTGPALIGAWRPCIVLPADFERRYNSLQRQLIVAHEAMHARRRDGLAFACATGFVALFWFNPMVWWARRSFRQDQELACDAAVLRERPGGRRSYALAMLKTQTAAQSLPAGCAWLDHPMKERIAMLNRPIPGTMRRIGGMFAIGGAILCVAGVVFAATQPLRTYHPSKELVAHARQELLGAETAVAAYMFTHNWTAPADNAQAGLYAPDRFHELDAVFDSVRVGKGGTVDVTLLNANGRSAGSLRLTPQVSPARQIHWSCTSGDIPMIADLWPHCAYESGPDTIQQPTAVRSPTGSTH